MFTRTLALGAALAVLLGTTVAGAAVKTTAHASATSRGLVVGTSRFFPVMLLDQCDASDVAHERTLGINLIVNESCPGLVPTRQLGLMRGTLSVLPIAARRAAGPALVGWTYPDEPELNGWTPASLVLAHPYPRGNVDGLVTFMTTGGGFFRRIPYRLPQVPRRQYARFAQLADMAGFDLYPLGHCQSDLSAVYDAQQAFIRLAGNTPTFQWIETGPIKPTYCGGSTMTPEELIAEVWLAVIGGARGIGYFTHTRSPDHRPFDVAPPIQQTMAQIDALLRSVTPGLLGTTLVSSADSPVVKVIARAGGNRTYVFAINTMRSPTMVQIHVPKLHDGPVTVLGEGRTVTASGHDLIDHFGGLQVNIYVQPR